jgi:hypothetical protein
MRAFESRQNGETIPAARIRGCIIEPPTPGCLLEGQSAAQG